LLDPVNALVNPSVDPLAYPWTPSIALGPESIDFYGFDYCINP